MGAGDMVRWCVEVVAGERIRNLNLTAKAALVLLLMALLIIRFGFRFVNADD